jgi:hypothetical protein
MLSKPSNNPFGALGYFAQEFLFRSSSHHPPTSKPPWNHLMLIPIQPRFFFPTSHLLLRSLSSLLSY